MEDRVKDLENLTNALVQQNEELNRQILNMQNALSHAQYLNFQNNQMIGELQAHRQSEPKSEKPSVKPTNSIYLDNFIARGVCNMQLLRGSGEYKPKSPPLTVGHVARFKAKHGHRA